MNNLIRNKLNIQNRINNIKNINESSKKIEELRKRTNPEYKYNWDCIDKVIYINLEERKDRLEQITTELKVIPENKLIRFNAIKDIKGHIGCSKSHIACLELAIQNNWKNVLIIEDDMIFVNYEEGTKLIDKLINKDFDVISLGNTHVNCDKNNYKLYAGDTTTAYIVNNHYYEKLLNNYKEGLKLLIDTYEITKYCLDKYWKKLQSTDNWFIIHPSLCIQSIGFSSIENKINNQIIYSDI
jgi:glycosyl transferase family 25